jgi:hypothetical protein
MGLLVTFCVINGMTNHPGLIVKMFVQYHYSKGISIFDDAIKVW